MYDLNTAPAPPRDAVQNAAVRAAFDRFILENDHPCLMAQTVFRMDQVVYNFYDTLNCAAHTEQILEDLDRYLNRYSFDDRKFYTFLAVFKHQAPTSEAEFERQLWQQLQTLHDADECPWDPSVSSDPQSGDFSFSLRGKAFYIVGLHPNSNRAARQAPYTAVAFNLHWQFEELRTMGAYQNLRDKIRQRDVERHGSYNPMMEDFGNGGSEARQYSGRRVDAAWRCPFLSKQA